MTIKYTFAFALLTSTMLSQNVNAAYTCEEAGDCLLNSTLSIKDIDTLVMKGNLVGGSKGFEIKNTSTHKHPTIIWEGKIDGYEGTFWAYYSNTDLPYAQYGTIIFKNWNPEQEFKFGAGSNGFFVFDKENTSATTSDKKSSVLITNKPSSVAHLFLNGHTLDKNSTNVSGAIYLGGPMTDDNGRTVTLDGYNMANAQIYSGGLLNTANGSVNTNVLNSTFNAIYGNGQSTNVNGDINLTIDNSNISAVTGSIAKYSDPSGSGNQLSDALIDGNMNINITNSTLSSLTGLSVQALGSAPTGITKDVNINVENTDITGDIRGITSAFYTAKGSVEWMDTYYQAHNFNITLKDSSVKNIYGLSSYMRGEDITINLLGEVDANEIRVGSSGSTGIAENTTLNFNTDKTINVANNIYAGVWNTDAVITGDTTFNMQGSGSAIVGGGISALNVNGKSTINMTDFSLTSGNAVTGFDEINIDEKSVLTAGELSLAQDAVVNVILDNADNHSKIVLDTLDVNGANIYMTVNNEGVYDLLSYTTNTSDFTWNLEHALYDIVEELGTVTVTTKSSEQLAEENGASEEQADALVSIIDAKDNGNDKSKELAEALRDAMQNGDSKSALDGAKDAAPTTSYLVTSIAKENADTIANTTFAHLDNLDASKRLWAQGVYNHAKQDGTSSNEEYSADSTGLALGADKDVSENTTLGLGYAYIDTDAEADNRDVNVKAHNIFVYGKYQPSQWYAKAILNYGMAEYEESKSALNVSLNGKYDVNYYSAQVMGGYEFDNGLTPEFGLRYLMVDADSYSDGAQNISVEKNDVLTAVLGTKYDKAINAELPFKLKANARFALTYDLVADDNTSTTVVTGGGQYDTTSEKLDRFGVEGGLGLTATVNNIDLSLEYNGAFRQDYMSNGGMIRVRYNF